MLEKIRDFLNAHARPIALGTILYEVVMVVLDSAFMGWLFLAVATIVYPLYFLINRHR